MAEWLEYRHCILEDVCSNHTAKGWDFFYRYQVVKATHMVSRNELQRPA